MSEKPPPRKVPKHTPGAHYPQWVKNMEGLHGALAESIGNPDRVWCRSCGRSQPVNASKAMREGWPKCCGYTMTIDMPEDPTP